MHLQNSVQKTEYYVQKIKNIDFEYIKWFDFEALGNTFYSSMLLPNCSIVLVASVRTSTNAL